VLTLKDHTFSLKDLDEMQKADSVRKQGQRNYEQNARQLLLGGQKVGAQKMDTSLEKGKAFETVFKERNRKSGDRGGEKKDLFLARSRD